MQTLGKKIRLLRHQKSWSQEDVAKQLGISIPAFSKIETGITDINLSRLEQISKLFEMTVVQLLNTHGAEDQEGELGRHAEGGHGSGDEGIRRAAKREHHGKPHEGG